MEPARVVGPFEFSGGALCLDFANTVSDRPRCTKEKLTAPADLLWWGQLAGVLPEGRGRPRARPGDAGRFERAIALREALYRIFSARAAAGRAAKRDLDLLNGHLRHALAHLELRPSDDGVLWSWAGSPPPLDRLVWSVARSAADLLTSSEIDNIRECASGTCSWLFLDHSRTRRRRWCEMKTCGNRAKARRHYRRVKEKKSR